MSWPWANRRRPLAAPRGTRTGLPNRRQAGVVSWVKSRAARPFRASPLVLLLFAICAVNAPARGCELAPARDGSIGAWLVAPSVHATDLESLVGRIRSRDLPDPESGLWRGQQPITSASGTLQLRHVLKGIGHPGDRAVLGGILRVEQVPLDALLLLRHDGASLVRLDGIPIWSQLDATPAGESWRVIPLCAPVGVHRLEVAVVSPDEDAVVGVRIVDRASFEPPLATYWVLPGLSEQRCDALRAELLETSVRWATVGGKPVVEVHLAARGGYPRGEAQAVRASVSRGPGAVVLPDRVVGAFPPPHPSEAGEVIPLGEVRHDSGWPAALRLRVTLKVANRTFQHTLGSSREAWEALVAGHDARGWLSSRATPLPGPEYSAYSDTLDMMNRRLASALESGDFDTASLEANRLRRFGSHVTRGEPPWQSPGVHEIAIRTSVADTPDRVLVHVPESYQDRSQTPRPLVVVLHGLGGSPEGILSAFLDQKLDRPRPGVDGFVLAPDAFGNTFYRGAGEQAVLDAIDWMLENYPVDRNRVSITGVSMGGTGTSHLGLRHAERFSALASLCGYESYFVRRDTSAGPRTDWERASMHHWSPASWADNGAGLGLMVARGTEDTPLSHSRVLVDSFTRAGLSVRTEWPEAGHRIWPIVYDGARLWPWLTAFRKEDSPSRVVLHTDSLRYGERAWVRLTRLDRTQERASIVAERLASGELVVRTQGVLGLTLSPRDAVSELVIDGQPIPVPSPSPSPISAVRLDNSWQIADQGQPVPPEHQTSSQHMKHAGLEGPIHDVFLDRLVFVYGTLDPMTRLANREVAEAWARGGRGVRLDYPVIADTEVTAATHGQASLFLVGNRHDHVLLARWSGALPIEANGSELRVATERYSYPEEGALFVYPNPEGERYIVVLTAPTLGGLWRSFSLPKLLPDFIVWDERLRAATGHQLLGDVPIIAAGRFKEDWSLPAAL